MTGMQVAFIGYGIAAAISFFTAGVMSVIVKAMGRFAKKRG
jgi:hypothetical protein